MWAKDKMNTIHWCICDEDIDLIESNPHVKEKINKKLKSLELIGPKNFAVGVNINEKERFLMSVNFGRDNDVHILFTRLPRFYLWKQTNEDGTIVGYRVIQYGKEKETEEWYKSKHFSFQTKDAWEKAQKEIWIRLSKDE